MKSYIAVLLLAAFTHASKLPEAPVATDPEYQESSMLIGEATLAEVTLIGNSVESDGCNGRKNGFFIQSFTSCQDYYVCWNNVANPLSCPNGFSFNMARQLCDFPVNVQCPVCNSTAGLAYVSVLGSCSQFVICRNDVANMRECLSPLNFNPTTSQCSASYACSEADLVFCPPIDDEDNLVFFPHTNCNKYYVCFEGAPVERSCETGLFFDVSTGGCIKATTCPQTTKARVAV